MLDYNDNAGTLPIDECLTRIDLNELAALFIQALHLHFIFKISRTTVMTKKKSIFHPARSFVIQSQI